MDAVSGWEVPGYATVGELGSGAFGRVVLGVKEATGAQVAIKYLSERLVVDERFRSDFRAEARLLSDLRSPHVVRLEEYIETLDGAAIVMELIAGVSLRTVLEAGGATSPEAALTVLKGSLLGLAHAHSVGVVHRDYKPENVLVSPEGSSKLVDFGIAVRSGTATGGAGTPSYMAPEQWRRGEASPAGDVYAAMAVFFECLTGRRLFVGDSLQALAAQHLSAEVPWWLVPEPVQNLVWRGLAKNPLERPGDAAVLVGELQAIADEAYGEDWERRGLLFLAAAVAGLGGVALNAGGQEGAQGSTALGSTELPQRRRPRPRRQKPHPGLPRPGLLHRPRRSRHPAGRRRRATQLAGVIVTVASLVLIYLVSGRTFRAEPISAFTPARPTTSPQPDVTPTGTSRPPPTSGPTSSTRTSPTPIGPVPGSRTPGDPTPKGTAPAPATTNSQLPDGTRTVSVPDVVGEEETAAQSKISAAGLVPIIGYAKAVSSGSGIVVRTDPAADVLVPTGSTVTLTISQASTQSTPSASPSPKVVTVTVPDVLDEDYDLAASQLRDVGLVPRRVDQESGVTAGTVLDQSPGPNTTVEVGSTVTVTVSIGGQRPVPSVIDDDETTARAALREAGFNVDVQYPEGSSSCDGCTVGSQSPGGGVRADIGSVVTVYLRPVPPVLK
jgi:serine/threonine protein kinase/beta-lactam-binding protein with PASTA domain